MAESRTTLYPGFQNPLLHRPERPLPQRVAIIGAGTIGPDIGYYLKSALPELELFLVDIAEEPLQRARERLEGYARKAVDRKKMKPDRAQAVLQNIHYVTDYARVAACELVIEAATENLPLKRRIFAQLESIVAPDALLTSNTSSIPAERIFAELKHPERATVTHFFAPAWRNLLVEVIRWSKASDATVDYLAWLFAATGKAPIVTADAICFVLDRIFDNWCNESGYLLDQATPSQVDRVAEEFVAAGPFFVLNLANGNPIIVETNTLQMEEGQHYLPAEVFRTTDRWETHQPGTLIEVPDAVRQQVRDRLLGILFSQSVDIADRGIGTLADINFGCVMALGFKQGPFDVMRDLGDAEVARIEARFQQERPGFPKALQPINAYQHFHRHLLVDDLDGVKVITLRRPQAMNALNDEVTAELLSVFQDHENDPAVSGFVVTGYGDKAFSAGADIGRFPSMLGDAAAAAAYARDCAAVQRHMDRMQKPVVAALNGLALGGGLEVAIRCHGLVALRGVRLGFPEISLGILPGIGGCVVPYRRWPQGATLFHDMILTGRAIKSEEAAAVGMVNELCDDLPGLFTAAVALVKRLAVAMPAVTDAAVPVTNAPLPSAEEAAAKRLSLEAIRITAQAIEEAAQAADFDAALEVGYRGFGKIACSAAAREGISAFLEKRPPRFTK